MIDIDNGGLQRERRRCVQGGEDLRVCEGMKGTHYQVSQISGPPESSDLNPV